MSKDVRVRVPPRAPSNVTIRTIAIEPMLLFKPGRPVIHAGRQFTVDHVIIRGYDVFVVLFETNETVHSSRLMVEPSLQLPIEVNTKLH